eukprot:jgi/Astpho2/1540/fgenesh1_pg.00026_%23_29_t
MILHLQSRWGSTLARILRLWRKRISVSVAWRPLYDHALRSWRTQETSYEGPMISGNRANALRNVVHRSRRFMPSGTVQDIWSSFRPLLQDTNKIDAQEALGWMCMFLPTQAIHKGDSMDWNSLVSDALLLLEADEQNQFWKSMWISILARLAKHDHQGLIKWQDHLPRLFTQINWAFSVPVGSSTAQSPLARNPSGMVAAAFSAEVRPISSVGAKLIVYLVGLVPAAGLKQVLSSGSVEQAGATALLAGQAESVPSTAGEKKGEQDAVLLQLGQLVDLLEQYFHPSNEGRWTKFLQKFLSGLCKHLMKRLQFENSKRDGSSNDRPLRAPLGREMQRRLAKVILRMADKAQFSKDNDMAIAACSAMSIMAYLAPDLVVPLVQDRFQGALENVTAAHQLVSAIHTLGLCVRPLLVSGCLLAPDRADGAGMAAYEDKVMAGEFVAGAMMATLPAIDANDPPKTLASFRFYCMVLSSVGTLQAGHGGLPLDAEEWVEGLLSRIFVILSNLESPETRGDHASNQGNLMTGNSLDHASFLLEGNSMFRPLVELLFARLPPGLQRVAMKHVTRFMLGTTMPSVSNEASLICNAAAWAAPEAAGELMLEPMMQRIEEELSHSGGGGARLSKASPPGSVGRVPCKEPGTQVQEGALDWLLSVLSATVMHIGPQLLPYKQRLKALLDAFFALPSKNLHMRATGLLGPILSALVSWYPLDQFAPLEEAQATGAANGSAAAVHLEPWVIGASLEEAKKWNAPKWHVPSPEAVEFAHQLLEAHMQKPAADLLAWAQSKDGSAAIPGGAVSAVVGAARSAVVGAAAAVAGSGSTGAQQNGAFTEKQHIQALVYQIEGTLLGLRSSLPELSSIASPAANSKPLHVVGACGPPIGSAAAREEVGRAMLAALRAVGSNDFESLSLMLRVLGSVLTRGSHEFSESKSSMSAWKSDQQAVHEPPVALLLSGTADGKWARMRPRWLTVERAYLHLLGRAGSSSHKWWATTAQPSPAVQTVPTIVKDVMPELVTLSLHSFRGVRDSASLLVEQLLKQYPCLSNGVMQVALFAMAKLPLPAIKFTDELDLPASIVEQLLEAAKEAAAAPVPLMPRQSSPSSQSVDTVKEEGLLHGAVGLLRAQPLLRLRDRYPGAFAGSVAALMATSRYTGPTAQQAISECFVLTALRMIRPPSLVRAQGQYPAGIQQLYSNLLQLLSPSQGPASNLQGQLHWRYALMANSILMFLLPPPNAQVAAQLMRHCLSLLLTQQISQQSIGMSGVLFLLRPGAPWRKDELTQAVEVTARETIAGNTAFGKSLLEQLSHSHPNTSAGQDAAPQSQLQRMLAMSRDDAIARSLGSSFEYLLSWPATADIPDSVRDQTFIVRHAWLVKVLAQAAPEEVLATLRAPLTEALADVAQEADRGRTFAAAEALGGLVASGSIFAQSSGDGESAWDTWVRPLLSKALGAAPLDLLEPWSVAVRYSVNGLAVSGHPGLAEVLDLTLEAAPGSTAAMMRRLSHLGQIVEELAALGVTGLGTVDNTRLQASPSKVLMPMVIPRRSIVLGRRFQRRLLSELPQQMEHSTETLRARASWGAAVLVGVLLWQPPCSSPDEQSGALTAAEPQPMELDAAQADDAIPRAEVDHFCSLLIDGLQAGVATIAPAPEGGEAAAASAPSEGPDFTAAVAKIGFAVQFLRNGLGNWQGKVLMPVIVGMLPHLLQAQELQQPQLQQLSLGTKSAVALLKYLPLNPSILPQVTALLGQASRGEPWSTRAAALAFAQYFWFRHCFLLGPRQSGALHDMVVSMLADKKLEVQELAAVSLSGLLKGLPQDQFEQLRQRFMQRVDELFPSKRQRVAKNAGDAGKLPWSQAAPSLTEKNAAVLGLMSFVLSSPYEVPLWLPDVLLSLVKAASQPAPVKTTVRRTLAEFRRTHEEACMAEARRLLTEEQWEAIQDVAFSTSYFV